MAENGRFRECCQDIPARVALFKNSTITVLKITNRFLRPDMAVIRLMDTGVLGIFAGLARMDTERSLLAPAISD